MFPECVTIAFAVAEFPLLLDDTDLIDHVLAGAVALWEQAVHLEVEPLYIKVALIDSDQRIVPFLFLYRKVLVFVIVLDVERADIRGLYVGEFIIIVSI